MRNGSVGGIPARPTKGGSLSFDGGKIAENAVNPAEAIRVRLADAGGQAAQELGFSKVAGRVLAYLYFHDGACPMEKVESDLQVSKAAVSIAARQLETMGLVRRIKKAGDRKCYYQTAENIGVALRRGLLDLVHRKLQIVGQEFDAVNHMIQVSRAAGSAEMDFLKTRIKRAHVLQNRAGKILESPLLKLLIRG